MTFTRIGLAGVIASVLAMPVMAQTTQTSPQQGTTSMPAAPRTTQAPGMPARTATSPTTNPGMAPRTAAPSGQVNINTASAAELDALPGIGKARAEAIIKNRPYKSPDELSSRHILPSNVYNKIKNDLVARPG